MSLLGVRGALVAAASALMLAACGSGNSPNNSSSDQSTGVPAASATQPAASCHAKQVADSDPQAWEPDPKCTPGATDGGLQLAQLCPTANTKAIRPPANYTDTLKADQVRAYGYTDPVSSYEEDHLIPLSLGGAPQDPENLWPAPGAAPNEKDKVEDAAHKAVCAQKLTLTDAQHKIATDWYGLGKQLGVIRQSS